MKIADRNILLCDCRGTMPLDANAIASGAVNAGLVDDAAAPKVHHCLCRDEIASARKTMMSGEPVLIACTQEIAAFRRAEKEVGASGLVDFVNVRETAGWSVEAVQAMPKILSLLAAATVEAKPPELVEIPVGNRVLVYGKDQAAFDAAERLSTQLDVSLVLDPDADVMLPGTRLFALEVGRAQTASGALGAFSIGFQRHAEIAPWSRDRILALGDGGEFVGLYDLVLDLSGLRPWFPDHTRRLGYVRPDLGRPEAIADGIANLLGLVGTIAKPRYVAYDASICAHSSSQKIGCTRCLDVCPTGALGSAAGAISVDHAVCAGCGSCAAVCPTEAMTYAAPQADATRRRMAVLLTTFLGAGGSRPILIVHSTARGEQMIGAVARLGRGLPANALPLAVRQPTQLGLDFFIAALALGAVKVVVQVDPEHADETVALREQVDLANGLMHDMGLDSGRVAVVISGDPDELLSASADDLSLDEIVPAVALRLEGHKRQLTRSALQHLAATAQLAPTVIRVPGLPFGRVIVSEACTVCLACSRSCPTGALIGDACGPSLSFDEGLCVQCGLCASLCPEQAITLEPRLSLCDQALAINILRVDEPATCSVCGTPFGSKRSIERVVARLGAAGWSARNSELIGRLKMCETCRVTAQ